MHKKVKHKPIRIQSLNIERGIKINDLELFFLLTQELLQSKIKSGRKGKILGQGNKMSYTKAQGVLFSLWSYFATQGCFSFGICANCEHFNNAISSSGRMGKCKGQEKLWCDTCSQHSIQGGGFGL